MSDEEAYAVLEVLAATDDTPLDELAKTVGVSRDDVVTAIERIRQLGVPVDQHPVYGAKLGTSLDVIVCEEVNDRLQAEGIDWRVHGLLDTESTNDLVNVAAQHGADDGTTYFAEHQTKGRGRLGRAWHSPVGSGLWFSTLRHHDLGIDEGWRVTIGAGIAVADAIRETSGPTPTLKWPNDVQIEGRKVAGILTESRVDGGRLKQSVIGIGINVHVDHDEFPAEFRETACSIASAGGVVKRADLLAAILRGLYTVLDTPADVLRSTWTEQCPHWGERVRVERDEQMVEGTAVELAENGAFVIELDTGATYPVHAGDVTHLRPVS